MQNLYDVLANAQDGGGPSLAAHTGFHLSKLKPRWPLCCPPGWYTADGMERIQP